MIAFIISVATLVISLSTLARASHFTIKNVEDLMEIIGLSEVAAGFAILAVITTLPEMTVAGFSVYQNVPSVSLGDILGSHVFNIGFVIGILALLGAFTKCGGAILIELVDILFLASVIPLLLVILSFAKPLDAGSLFLYDWFYKVVGLTLIGVFVFSIFRMVKGRSPSTLNHVAYQKKNQKGMLLKIFAGAIVAVISARFVVSSASEIALTLGVPPIVIGAKIVAIGTSLPELAFGFAAVKKGLCNLVLGDIIGANLTTITLVLGIVLVASPFKIDMVAFLEMLVFVLIVNLVLWRYLTKGGITQLGGITLLLIYVMFQAFLSQ
ncbi:MAG: hypothetical protein QW146_08750 [Candidatus Bathyarchaeia archaeon]